MPNKDQGTYNTTKTEEDGPNDIDSDNGIKDTEDVDQKGSQEKDKEDAHTKIIYEERNNPKVTNDHSLQIKLVASFTITYQRGERHVFATSKGQGAMHSSSTPMKYKGKQPVKEEEDDHEEEDNVSSFT